MISDFRFNVSHTANSELENLLQQKIREFNNGKSPHHLAVRQEGAVKTIHITVSNPDNKLIAGIYAEMYWGWLDINYLWVEEEYRSLGIGSLLLAKSENEAKRHQCTKAMLTTFSFQAKDFYLKYGYSAAGQVEDYPPGSVYYTLVKNL